MRNLSTLFPALVGVLLVGAAFFVAPMDVFADTPLPHSTAVKAALWCGATVILLAGVALIAARRRVSAVNLALVVGTAIVCLVASEIALGIAGVQPIKRIVLRVPESYRWWQSPGNWPDAPMWRGNRPVWAFDPVGVNAQHFIDTDEFVPERAQSHPRRVLLLGDSFAYGATASSRDKSFAELLDAQLDSTIPSIVWNASIPGTGQEVQFASFSRWAPVLKPQVVVSTLFSNDFEDNTFPPGRFYVFSDGKWVDGFARTPDGGVTVLPPARAYRRAFAPGMPREYLKASRVATAAAALIRRLQQPNAALATPLPYVPGATPGYEQTFEWIKKLRDASHEASATMLVLLIPDRGDFTAPSHRYQDMQRICSELSIEAVEMLDVLTTDDYAPWPDDHWNDSGHAKVAAHLQREIESMALKTDETVGDEKGDPGPIR